MAGSDFLLEAAATVYFLYRNECKTVLVKDHGNILAYETAEEIYLFRLTNLLI
jgi:hypothetical protein